MSKVLGLIQFLIMLTFLILFFMMIFRFIFTRKPISKILILAFSYNVLLFFFIYNIYIFNKEVIVFDFLVFVVFSFLLNILNGTFIINNIIKNTNEYDY